MGIRIHMLCRLHMIWPGVRERQREEETKEALQVLNYFSFFLTFLHDLRLVPQHRIKSLTLATTTKGPVRGGSWLAMQDANSVRC